MAALHYGQTVFEGLKAFRSVKGETLLFRPEEHAKRMNVSASRLCMPEIPEELFLEGLYALLGVDNEWIPKEVNSSLYIRPLMFATDEALGVAACKNYTFIIMTCPVSSYYEGAVKVVIETEYVRADAFVVLTKFNTETSNKVLSNPSISSINIKALYIGL